MAKVKSFYYIIDSLNNSNAVLLKKALMIIPEVHDVLIKLSSGIIEVKASKDVTANVKSACEVAGTRFRVEVKEKDLY
jgi:hypothetical protein